LSIEHLSVLIFFGILIIRQKSEESRTFYGAFKKAPSRGDAGRMV